jgi:MFS family permease
MAFSSIASIRALSPLRYGGFRQIYLAMLLANISLWMQSIAAAWLMTTLSTSPLQISLLQTATSLPAFLIGLPAGALADILDRLKLLAGAQGWLVLTVGGVGLLTVFQWVSPELLLLFTFLSGLAAALSAPIWEALIPQFVPREEVPEASALYGSGIDLSRAIGPVIAGGIVAFAGAGAVFLLNAFLGLGLILLLRWVLPLPPRDELMTERVLSALRAGFRYALHSPPLQVVLWRTGLFMFCGSALWALLPVLARYQLGLGSGEYGILFGVMGIGSILGTFFLPQISHKFSRDVVVLTASCFYALVLLGLSYGQNFAIICLIMVLAGFAWTALMVSFSVAAQIVAPDWVRARSLSLFQLVLQGSMAIGSLVWGAIANFSSTPQALTYGALGLAISLIAAIPLRFQAGENLNLAPAHHAFQPLMAVDPQPEDGPVLVMLEYDIQPDQVQAFVETIQPLRLSRERDGAIRWDLWQDVSLSDRFVECFIVESWGEHYRQYQRFTVSDQAIEDQVRSFLRPGTEPTVRFFIFAKTKRMIPALVMKQD